MHQKLFFLFLAVGSLGCKKEVDIPPELRPNEFQVSYTITDENGVHTDYAYRGEDTTSIDALQGLTFSLFYFSNSGIRDSIKRIDSGLASALLGAPFTLRLYQPELVTDPFTPAEWHKQALEAFIYTGKSFEFGNGPGKAEIILKDYPEGQWTCSSTGFGPQNSYLRVLEVSDYGSPDIGVPYFGKKVKIEFAAALQTNSGQQWSLKHGEAVLFFRYYIF